MNLNHNHAAVASPSVADHVARAVLDNNQTVTREPRYSITEAAYTNHVLELANQAGARSVQA